MAKHFFALVLIASILIYATSGQTTCEITELSDGTETSDCPQDYQCVNQQCVQAPRSLFPLEPIEWVGIALVMIITGLASAGGIGGGPVLSPVLLIFFSYTENQAIMVVYAIIFGGSLANFINAGLKRDPYTGKPFLNYDLALICVPPMLLGTTAGIILNKAMPTIVIVLGLVSATYYTFSKLFKKARSEFKRETRLKMGYDDDSFKDSLSTSISEISDEESTLDERLQKILNEEHKLLPPVKLAKTICLLGFMILMALLRGTSSFESIVEVQYCEAPYWLFFVVAILGCLMFYLINKRTIFTMIKIKHALGYRPEEGEFEFKRRDVRRVFPLSILAGILSGLLGIGGGTVMSPLLLTLGLKPQVLSATCGFFIVQTSFISLVSAALYGVIPLSELGFFLVLSFIGSYGLSTVLNALVKKYERPSIILFTLSFVLFVSLFGTPIYEISTNIHNLQNLLTFGSIC